MATGTVKWFNNKKGYGFITPDEGGQDIFVHISAVQKAGLRSLEEGAKISYELLSERGKKQPAATTRLSFTIIAPSCKGVLGSKMFSSSIAEITASTVVPVRITSVRSEF